MLFVLFLSALTIRVGYDLFCRRNYFFYNNPSADVVYYQHWSAAVAVGNLNAQKHFFGLPLYPETLAIIKRLALFNPDIVRLLHLILGALNCVLAAQLGWILFSPAAGILAGILCAINFTLIHYDWLMMPVPLLITLSLVVAIGLAKKDLLASRQWFILGGLIGLAMNGDPKFIFFAGLVMIWLFLTNRTGAARPGCPSDCRQPLCLLIIGIALIMVLAGVRSRVIHGNWIFISPEGGLNLYLGNNPAATGIFDNPDFIRPSHAGHDQDQKILAQQIAGRRLSAAETSELWKQKALEFIKSHPADFTRLLLAKARWFFTDTEAANEIDLLLQRGWQRKSDINPFWIICPLAITGWLFVRPRNPQTVILDFFIISQLIITLIFFHYTRHRTSILPFLIIYEAAAIIWLLDEIRARRWQKPLAAAVVGLAVFFIFPRQAVPSAMVKFLDHSKKGAIYSQRGEYEKAQRESLSALAIYPHDTNNLYNLGTNYLLQNDIPLAKKYLEMVLQINPLNTDAMFNLGYAYSAEGQEERAIAVYQKVLELEPESADALFQLAVIYQANNHCREANDYFDRLLTHYPGRKTEIEPLRAKCFDRNR